MKSAVVAALVHCMLFAVLVQSAPVGSASELAAFRGAAERAKMLVEKILKDIPAVHAATITTEGLSLDASGQTMVLMVRTLGLPDTPIIKPLSERFTLDMYVSRMFAGSRLYQGLLGVLSDHLSGLNDLRSELRDLQTQISKMREAAQIDVGDEDQNKSLDLASHLHGHYEVQVAAHLTLSRLRSFCHDLIRSLRAATTYRPMVAV